MEQRKHNYAANTIVDDGIDLADMARPARMPRSLPCGAPSGHFYERLFLVNFTTESLD